MSSPNLLAIYVRTSTGDSELASPANGLSINQRKLLQWCDGQLTVADMSDRLAAGHTVDSTQVVRDIERLEKLSLLSPLGASVLAASATRAQTYEKKRMPWWLAGAGALVLLGGLVAFARQSSDPVAATKVAANGTPAANLAPEETEEKIFGVMPNPARWFAPGQKAETKPVEEKQVSVPTKAEARPVDPKLAQAMPVTKAVAPAPVTPTTAPAPLPVEPVAPKAEPAPTPAPVQVASAQPIFAKPEPPAPNRKPVYREQPEFPKEAARDGIESGSVRARMTINEAGQVVKVDILESKPRKVFDRAVLAALSKWKFQQAASPFTVETEVDFKDN